MILEARQLAIGYGDRVIGQGLDVTVGPGEVLALLGPNGGGKTTLLKTLLGLIPPLAGEVLIAGRRLSELALKDRAKLLAYVPQVHAGTFAFTVEDVVLMGRTAHGGILSRPSERDREIAAAAIARLGIMALAGRPYTLISGGERQLALIARALAQEPRLVVLDEPTASLDFGNQGIVMAEIRRLAETGLAVVFSTHDPNHALRHADRAMLIRGGQCVASGRSADVISRDALQGLYGCRVDLVGTAPELAFLPAAGPLPES
ncbi:MAG: ABC transporter ATP-binding protein [Alsobacter sp.]